MARISFLHVRHTVGMALFLALLIDWGLAPHSADAQPITGIEFHWSTHRREAEGGDNWPITWAADGNQYTHGGDGYGWSGSLSSKASNFIVRISGNPDNYIGQDRFYSGDDCKDACGKTYGLVGLDGVLYKWLAPGSGPSNWKSQTLYKSVDGGLTWSRLAVEFLQTDGIGAPTILQFGRDYTGARDEYVYMYWTVIRDATQWDIQKPGAILLSRVPIAQIENQAAYQWLTSTDSSKPTWGNLASAVPVFTDKAGLFRNSAIYQPSAGRYILITEHAIGDVGNIRMHEAPEPWGPWTTFFAEDGWPQNSSGSPYHPVLQSTFFWNFSPKWWNGLNGVLVFTGKGSNDSWNSVKVTLSVDSLPVELVDFDAILDHSEINLRWRTSSETNNAGFEVQQIAQSEEQWTTVAFVEGAGTTTEPREYYYKVSDVAPGHYQFRLKQIDFDGAFHFSPTIEVMVPLEVVEPFDVTHQLTHVYPNPFVQQAEVQLVLPTAQAVRASLYDALGREVALLHDGHVAANTPHVLTIDGGALPSGFYMLRVQGETFSAVRKLVRTP